MRNLRLLDFVQNSSGKKIKKKEKRNYKIYEFSKEEKMMSICICSFVVLFFSFFFYRNLYMSVILMPIGIFLYRQIRKQKKEKQLASLSMQFKECILCVAANLRAGYSAENAFCQSMSDMSMLFGDKSLIVEELLWIKQGLQNNMNLEELLLDFSERTGLEDLEEFAQVFAIAKRGGGNLPAVISDTAVLLSDQIEMQREIQVLISGKQFEQKIMSLIPFGIVCYIEISTPGYFKILYGNKMGFIVMSICLCVYLVAYVVAQKITDFKWKGG